MLVAPGGVGSDWSGTAVSSGAGLGPPATGQILGTAGRHELESALAAPGQARCGAPPPRRDLPVVHRRVCHGRPRGGQSPPRGPGVTVPGTPPAPVPRGLASRLTFPAGSAPPDHFRTISRP